MKRKQPVKYHELVDLYYFKREGRVFLKVANSHALDVRSGKDAVFALHDVVEPLYMAPADYV